MSLVAVAPMTEKKKAVVEYCVYTSTKIDDQVMPLVRIAAIDKGMAVQDYISDVMNEIAARDAGRKPVKRRPPMPRVRRGPKPLSE